MKIKLFFVFMACTTFCFELSSQETTTQGKEFWCSFFTNFDKTTNPTLTFIISSQNATTITISNPLTNWSRSVNCPANGQVQINLDTSELRHAYTNSLGIHSTGLHITSTDMITLYSANYKNTIFDASNILPIHSLSDEYIVQTYTGRQQSPSQTGLSHAPFAGVIAVEDDVEIDITPTVLIEDGIAQRIPGVMYSIFLKKGEVYHFESATKEANSQLKELSGTKVKAHNCKKIAVFSGNHSTSVPANPNVGDVDHIYAQLWPLSNWGKNFMLVGCLERKTDKFRLTASTSNTIIKKDGADYATMDEGETIELEISSEFPTSYIEASNPICVIQYLTSHKNGASRDSMGDPSMAWVSPIELKLDKIIFSTFKGSGNLNHYVNIVTKTDGIASTTLNGTSISSHFEVIPSNPNYSYARIKIQDQSHTLICNSGFNALVYGLTYAESYAYSVGSAVMPTKNLTINGFESTSFDNLKTCANEIVNFKVMNTKAYDSIRWFLGDGSTYVSVQDTFNYAYGTAGDYDVMAIFYLSLSVCQNNNFKDTVFGRISILPVSTASIKDSVCFGSGYFKNGFSISVDKLTDIQAYTFYDSIPGSQGCCDTIITLNLHVLRCSNISETLRICRSKLPHTWRDTVFEVGSVSGNYIFVRTDANGNDSIVELSLRIDESSSSTISKTACDSYTWNGETYTSSGVYTFSDVNAVGCDSIVELVLTIGKSTISTIDKKACDSYTWNGETYTTSGTYTFLGMSEIGCDSTVILVLTIDTSTYLTTSETVCGSYIWNGQTYTSSGVYTFTGLNAAGCNLEETLNLTILPKTVLSIAPSVPLCADQLNFFLPFTFHGEQPQYYTLKFGDSATKNGFVNQHNTPIAGESIVIPIPQYERKEQYVRPNIYSLAVIVNNGACDSDTVIHEFMIQYPSWLIEQKWNDVLSLLNNRYNGGYLFSSYQWYKNGSPLSGETASYLYNFPDLDYNAQYQLQLTRADDGVKLFTCAITPQYKPNFKVYPQMVKAGEVVKIESDISGEVIVWNSLGQKLAKHTLSSIFVNELRMDYPMGLYLLEMKFTNKDESKIVKVVVK